MGRYICRSWGLPSSGLLKLWVASYLKGSLLVEQGRRISARGSLAFACSTLGRQPKFRIQILSMCIFGLALFTSALMDFSHPIGYLFANCQDMPHPSTLYQVIARYFLGFSLYFQAPTFTSSLPSTSSQFKDEVLNSSSSVARVGIIPRHFCSWTRTISASMA